MWEAGDEALMALVVDGDSEAFALLYERHLDAATLLARRLCVRQAVAEEVVQEAFLSCWRARGLFDGRRGSVRGWLLGIVRNRAIDALRRSSGDQLADWRGPEWRSEREPQESAEESARELLSALHELPPEQSSVIALAYYGGYTHVEIAAMLGTPVGTVKGRMRLGLRKLARGVTGPA